MLLKAFMIIISSFLILPTPPNPSEIIGEINYNGYIIKYGVNDSEGIIEINNKTITIHNEDYNYNRIRYVAIIDDSCFIAVNEFYNIDNLLGTYKLSILIKYNYEGDKVDSIILDERPISYHNHDNYLVLKYNNHNKYVSSNMIFEDFKIIETNYLDVFQIDSYYQGSMYVNEELVETVNINYPGIYNIKLLDGNYIYQYRIIIDPLVVITGEKFNDDYLSDIVIESKGEIYLNGKIYLGETINIPGKYSLKIYGENNYIYEDNFILYPKVTYFDGVNTYDFVDQTEFFGSLVIFTNAISILLDDKMYESEYIENTGKHNLTIYGINDLKIDLTFYIYPNLEILEETSSKIKINIFGDALINGIPSSGLIEIKDTGDYEVVLLYEDKIYKSYSFTIETEEDIIEEENGFNFSYIFVVLLFVGGYIILSKK